MMAAESEVEAASTRVQSTGPVAKEAEARAKDTEAKSRKATAKSDAAHAPLKELLDTYKTKKAAKEAAERQEKHLKVLADKAGKRAWEVEDAFNRTQKKSEQFDRDFALAGSGLCAGMFGTCGGQLPPGKKPCCQLGCQCLWKDGFYAQCHAPPGKAGCDPAAEEAEAKATKAKFVELKQEHARTAASDLEATKAWKEAASKASELRRATAAARAAKDEALEIAKAAGRVAKVEDKEARAARAKATHATHAIRYAELAVKAWRRAADGAACKDDDADDDAAEGEALATEGHDSAHELRFLKHA